MCTPWFRTWRRHIQANHQFRFPSIYIYVYTSVSLVCDHTEYMKQWIWNYIKINFHIRTIALNRIRYESQDKLYALLPDVSGWGVHSTPKLDFSWYINSVEVKDLTLISSVWGTGISYFWSLKWPWGTQCMVHAAGGGPFSGPSIGPPW